MKYPKLLVAIALIAAILLAPRANAQFVGDLFFDDPSITAAQGAEAELRVEFFAGTAVHGAVAFDLVYDTDDLEIVRIETPRDGGYDAITWRDAPGAAGVASFNDDSLDGPIGTANVARIFVRPIAQPGAVVSLAIQPRAAIRANRSSFAPGQGFSASITVVDPISPPATVLEQDLVSFTQVGVPHPIDGSFVPFRPLGHAVTVRRPSDDPNRSVADELVVEHIQTIDPAAPSEATDDCPADADRDGSVNADDLLIVLAAFGDPCP